MMAKKVSVVAGTAAAMKTMVAVGQPKPTGLAITEPEAAVKAMGAMKAARLKTSGPLLFYPFVDTVAGMNTMKAVDTANVKEICIDVDSMTAGCCLAAAKLPAALALDISD